MEQFCERYHCQARLGPQMPKAYYCCSQYDQVITDLNPLIPQAYPFKDILVICARDQQQIRLTCKKNCTENLTVASWWDNEAFNNTDKLNNFDVVVILDRDRIDPGFHPMLEWVERVLGCKLYNRTT